LQILVRDVCERGDFEDGENREMGWDFIACMGEEDSDFLSLKKKNYGELLTYHV